MDNQSDLSEKQKAITNQVNDFFSNYSKPQNFPFFTMNLLESALISFENSPVVGFDLLSYNLIKKSISDVSKNLILFFYNTMLF